MGDCWHIYLLQPFLDGVKRGYRNGIYHRHFLAVVLVDNYHIKVLQVKLNPLKVNQLNFIQCHHKRWLSKRNWILSYKYFANYYILAISNTFRIHYIKDN